MKNLNFNVEKTDTGYSAYCENAGNGIIATTGDTISELVRNAVEAANLHFDYHGKKSIAAEHISLVYDLPQFFEYYSIINTSALAARIAMNRALLNQYINGQKKPSKQQAIKILQGVKDLAKELASADFAL